MKFKIKCIKSCTIIVYGDIYLIKENEIENVKIDDLGLRIEYKKGYYTKPFSIREIEKNFIGV